LIEELKMMLKISPHYVWLATREEEWKRKKEERKLEEKQKRRRTARKS
jgi:hypothetical protein